MPETIYRRLMRVHLDSGKCQGHNRCYALAPELFDVDDYGQAVLLVEDEVPERPRGQGPPRSIELPRVRDHDHGVVQT